MYGIEYPALANSIFKQEKDNNKLNSNSNKKIANGDKISSSSIQTLSDLSSIFNQQQIIDSFTSSTNLNDSNLSNKNSNTTQSITDVLRQKLKSMNECPDYLIPKCSYSNSFFSSNSINSNESLNNSNLSSKSHPNLSSQSSTTSSRSSNKNKYLHLSSNQDIKNYYTDDFILLSEFSEIEGPKPLLTIPTDGGTGFNKNEYSLHLMCVDFHSHLQTSKQQFDNHDTTAIPVNNNEETSSTKSLNKFSLTKDTSIINYWDVNSTVAGVVHHFTLYDLDARGFVRPFCLAYISFDKTKPVHFFESIKDKFTEITDLFKRSNFNLFKHELEQRCLDLKYTRDFFTNWYLIKAQNQDNELMKLSRDLNLDMKIVAKLNSSSLNEQTRQLQLNAIDSLIKEMELILDVVLVELKLKNWFIESKCCTSRKSSSNKINGNNNKLSKNVNHNAQNYEKCQSAVDPLMNHPSFSNDNEITLITPNHDEKLKSTRSNTYPSNGTINSNHTKKTNNNQKTNHLHLHNHKLEYTNSSYHLHKPKLYTNILIGNSTAINTLFQFNDNIIESQTNFMLSQSLNSSFNIPIGSVKKFKRLHQLCVDTAKQAINELRLMHYHFSKPYYLLKYKQIASSNLSNYSNISNSVSYNSTLNNVSANSSSNFCNQSNLFWSITLGDCKIADFSTQIDLFNLNKSALIKKTNKNEVNFINNNNSTQFFSPLNQSIQIMNKIETSSSTNDEFYSIINKESSSSCATTTWQEFEQYLNESISGEEEENEEEEEENESLSSDPETYIDFEEENYNNNNNNKNNKSNEKDENEYDFANSLLTINKNLDNLSISSQLSITSSSAGLYYSVLNKQNQKYQTELITKLSQISDFNFERTLKDFLAQYLPVMPHLMYSILKGRPVICVSRYCQDLQYLQSILDCLSNFIPNSFYCLNDLTESSLSKRPKFTSSPSTTTTHFNITQSISTNSIKPQLKQIFERKSIKLNDLKYCKLFGLNLLFTKDGTCCSSECNEARIVQKNNNHFKYKNKHYHLNAKQMDDQDLIFKFIPVTIQNYVSILDLDKQTYYGPKYRGTYLTNSIEKCKFLQQDSICYLYLLSNVIRYYIKISFLYNYSVLFDSNLNSKHNKRDKILKNLALNNTSSENSQSNNSYYSTLASTFFSLNSSLSSSYQPLSTNQNKIERLSNSSISYLYDDIDLMRLILAQAQSQNFFSYLPSNSNMSSVPYNAIKATSSYINTQNLCQFDQCDLNIVSYLLKSMKIKQIYLYNLAQHKKKLKEFKKMRKEQLFQQKGGSTLVNIDSNYANLHFDTNIQLPLLIEYEDMVLIHANKK